MTIRCSRALARPTVLIAVLACLVSAACTPSAEPDAVEVSAGPAAPTRTEAAAAATAPTGEVGDHGPAANALVVRVVDGDTLEVTLPSGRERVRLIGIDTPESVKPDSEVECYGVAASQHLAELLPEGTEVELLRDVELRDRYDRLLAYVFRRSDGLFVNLSMAAEGYANSLSMAPNVTFADDMRAAVARARQAGLGLWRDCPEPDALFR